MLPLSISHNCPNLPLLPLLIQSACGCWEVCVALRGFRRHSRSERERRSLADGVARQWSLQQTILIHYDLSASDGLILLLNQYSVYKCYYWKEWISAFVFIYLELQPAGHWFKDLKFWQCFGQFWLREVDTNMKLLVFCVSVFIQFPSWFSFFKGNFNYLDSILRHIKTNWVKNCTLSRLYLWLYSR